VTRAKAPTRVWEIFSLRGLSLPAGELPRGQVKLRGQRIELGEIETVLRGAGATEAGSSCPQGGGYGGFMEATQTYPTPTHQL